MSSLARPSHKRSIPCAALLSFAGENRRAQHIQRRSKCTARAARRSAGLHSHAATLKPDGGRSGGVSRPQAATATKRAPREPEVHQCTLLRTDARTHARARARALSHPHIHSDGHAHSDIQAHTHTLHTHAHTRSRSPLPGHNDHTQCGRVMLSVTRFGRQTGNVTSRASAPQNRISCFNWQESTTNACANGA